MRQHFDDTWIATKEMNEGFSYPADKPIKRIDYILTRQSDQIKAKRVWIVETLASDHVPVVAIWKSDHKYQTAIRAASSLG
jgi:endonuclease/exonuclease/phosphatase family metal-dependent hydrolase